MQEGPDLLPREPGTVSGSRVRSLVLFLVAVLLTGALTLEAADRTAERLRGFLTEQNAAEAVLVSALRAVQGGQALPVYAPLGREEERRGLWERLIVTPAEPAGPFVRGSEWVLRVDRTRPLSVRVRMDLIAPRGTSGLERRVPDRVRLHLRPSGERRWLTAAPDGFTFELAAGRHDRTAEVQVLSRDRRHTLRLLLLDARTPVTVQPPAAP